MVSTLQKCKTNEELFGVDLLMAHVCINALYCANLFLWYMCIQSGLKHSVPVILDLYQ